ERLWGGRLGLLTPLGQAEHLARDLRQAGADLRCDLRVGVALRLRVARLAARAAEAGVRAVDADGAHAFLDPLPLTWCDGLGAAARTVLADCGLTTLAQARAVGAVQLHDLLGGA